MQINESEIKRRNRLYKLFDNIKLTGGTLIIGGDFFDFWFEFGKKAPKIYSDVFEELESLKQHGIDIHYVAGNHDYWNFGYFESTFLKSFYKDDFSINKFGLKILVTHGDGLLKSDVGYRALKKVIRNKIFIFLFKIFGERIGYKIGSKASAYYPHYYQKKQSEKSKEQNSDEIKADILEFANNMWSKWV